ncbi:MAG TPA: PilZ domain-containing protein [Stellaceae bacterium]|nr:PilZ domain-containing protein [Stellaceae bacterium]
MSPAPAPLTAVFRRISNVPPELVLSSVLPPVAPSPRPVSPSSPPQLLGFAEPVVHIPPIEGFLPREEPGIVPPPRASEAPATPEPPSAPPKSSYLTESSEPVSIRARVRDLPPPPDPDEVALVIPRPQNLVGRLGRWAEARQGSVGPSELPVDAAPPRHAVEQANRPALARNRRLYRRAKLPAEIEIDGVPCTLIDVSIGGFAATGVPPLQPNTQLPVTIRLTIDGIEVGTLLQARIIYVTQGRSSGRFVELSPSQMAFLRYIVTWRGESVGAVGTTTLLDAISSGPERGYGPGTGMPSDPEAKSRWWAGLIGRKVNPPR